MKKTYRKNLHLNESNILPITLEEFQKREALKTCPLCKGAPRYVGGGAIECSNPACHLTLEKETWEEVRDAWNERPDTEEVIEILNDRLSDLTRIYDALVSTAHSIQSRIGDAREDMDRVDDIEDLKDRLGDTISSMDAQETELSEWLEEMKPLLEPWETQE
jgi:hypothetical protein